MGFGLLVDLFGHVSSWAYIDSIRSFIGGYGNISQQNSQEYDS
jgi:hypothetical protein